MKIKVFKFLVANTYYREKPWRRESESDKVRREKVLEELDTELAIEDSINDFIQGKKVLDIKTHTVDAKYHNNGHSNTIELYYTIMYEDIA